MTGRFYSNDKSLTRLGSFAIPHGHTVSVDPKTHLVYFPLENVDGQPLLRIMRPVDHVRRFAICNNRSLLS